MIKHVRCIKRLPAISGRRGQLLGAQDAHKLQVAQAGQHRCSLVGSLVHQSPTRHQLRDLYTQSSSGQRGGTHRRAWARREAERSWASTSSAFTMPTTKIYGMAGSGSSMRRSILSSRRCHVLPFQEADDH